MGKKKYVFEVNLKNLLLGIVAGIMISLGLFLYMSVLTGKIIINTQHPREDRAIYIIVSWILIVVPFLIISTKKTGIVDAIAVFLGLYLSFAFTTGSFMVLDASSFIDIAVAMKILIAPIFFIVILVVLLYNAVSGKLFFRAIIFGLFAIGFLALGSYLEII